MKYREAKLCTCRTPSYDMFSEYWDGTCSYCCRMVNLQGDSETQQEEKKMD